MRSHELHIYTDRAASPNTSESKYGGNVRHRLPPLYLYVRVKSHNADNHRSVDETSGPGLRTKHVETKRMYVENFTYWGRTGIENETCRPSNASRERSVERVRSIHGSVWARDIGLTKGTLCDDVARIGRAGRTPNYGVRPEVHR